MPTNPCRCMTPRPTRQHADRIAELVSKNKELTDKVERLEKEIKLLKAGWRTGDAEDFLQ